MHWLGIIVLMISAWALTAWLTGRVRAYALKRALIDIPNERSSHTVPTPRGGGLAIAAVMSVCVLVLGISGAVQWNELWALLGGGVMVAGIGWWDDHRHVPPLWRALVHLLAAVWALYWLGGYPEIHIGGMILGLGWIGSLLAVLAIVWLINLYNFMDGIDGIAGVEVVTAGVGGAILLAWAGASGLAMVSLVMAAAGAGFLWWNWPPAKIFMGDIGSGLLGYCFAVVALAGENSVGVPAIVWLFLLGVFVLDATFTLIQRVISGERWYTAHRSHAYQRLVQLGYSHHRVSIGVAGLNLLLLFPVAMLSWVRPEAMTWCLIAVTVAGGLLWNSIQRRFRDAVPAK